MTPVKATDIKNVTTDSNKTYIVLIYDTHALVRDPDDVTISDKWIRIPDGQEMTVPYNVASSLPGFRSKHLVHNSTKIMDYREAPTKKWAYEYKIAQMIANHCSAEIHVYDTCIAIGCNTVFFGYTAYLCYGRIFAKYPESPIRFDLSFPPRYYDDPDACEPIMRGPLIGKLSVDRARTIDAVYFKIIGYRARGFTRYSKQLSDINIVSV